MQVQAELGRADAPNPIGRRSLSWNRTLGIASVVVAALFFATSLTAYLTDAFIHTGELLNWFDLNVYNDAGLVTRQLPVYLYKWQLGPTVKFTYTPFAGIVFAAFSYIGWPLLRWLMTLTSLLSLPITAWLTLGALGRRGLGRAAMALAIGAFALWTEPVTKALFLGQIEPLLLLLVAWDLTRNDEWRWKGIGIGVAAGIKLIPLLFIPYLLAAGKIRQAAAATAAFAATVAIGFIVLPEPSISYWLSGYFVRPGRTGGVDALVNQSLLGMIARQSGGGVAAQPAWLPIAVGVGLIGIAGAALLARSGRPVHGWVLIGLTSLLISPISWDHHWVWIIPVIALLAGELMTSQTWRRWLFLAGAVLVTALFGAWPWDYSGPDAYVPQRGLVGWFVRPPLSYNVLELHGWQLLTWNLFVVAGLVIFVIMLVVAGVSWRQARRPVPPALPSAPPPPPEPEPAPEAEPEPLPSPIDALLARADSLLTPPGS
ncbi:MAG TPA: glycosyltransferase 87 family protein [Streptosporangiaceae bacterium]|nr:glycosyltransferase 87 family protein [Streptosporangiaceae bacterium]